MEAESENENLLASPHQQRVASPKMERLEIQNANRPNQANPSNDNSCCAACCPSLTFQGWLTLLSFLLLLLGSVYLKIEADQRYNELLSNYMELKAQVEEVESNNNARYTKMRNEFDVLQSQEIIFESSTHNQLNDIGKRVALQNSTATVEFNSLWSTVNNHDEQLVRLSNGTSNADVLDKLKETKEAVSSELQTTKTVISTELIRARTNVTLQLQQSRLEFQQTQIEVNQHLDSTVQKMRKAVNDATSNIYLVQQNVTNQMNYIGMQLAHTVQELSDNVEEAQQLINEEVNHVKGDIEQYVAFTNKQFAAENAFVKYQLAGLFTLLSSLIFLWHLTQHMRHYHKPDVQNRVMGILWMVPIYGITSWLSMVYAQSEPYLAAFRDCFESYVVYTFVGFLIAVLSDGLSRHQLVLKLAKEVEHERLAIARFNSIKNSSTHGQDDGAALAEEEATKLVKPKEHLVPPLPCCYGRDPYSTAISWLNQCQLLAMQFVFVKPLLTVIPAILYVSHAYDIDKEPYLINNNINWESPKLYVLILQNISVALAFYGLLSFYHGVEKDLEWCDPWPKFLCIKGVVFLTFWQYVGLQIMSTFGLVDEKAASQIQNLLICIEMLIASIAHFYIFPHQEWTPGYQRAKQRNILLRDTMAFGDFLKDMKSMFTRDVEEANSPEKMQKEESKFDDVKNPLLNNESVHNDLLLATPPSNRVLIEEGKTMSLMKPTLMRKESLSDQEALIMEELEEKISLLAKFSTEEEMQHVQAELMKKKNEYYQSGMISPKHSSDLKTDDTGDSHEMV